MHVEPLSVALGLIFAISVFVAFRQGQADAVRQCRRVVRTGGNLDRVFFEDAERDPEGAREQETSSNQDRASMPGEWYSSTPVAAPTLKGSPGVRRAVS